MDVGCITTADEGSTTEAPRSESVQIGCRTFYLDARGLTACDGPECDANGYILRACQSLNAAPQQHGRCKQFLLQAGKRLFSLQLIQVLALQHEESIDVATVSGLWHWCPGDGLQMTAALPDPLEKAIMIGNDACLLCMDGAGNLFAQRR